MNARMLGWLVAWLPALALGAAGIQATQQREAATTAPMQREQASRPATESDAAAKARLKAALQSDSQFVAADKDLKAAFQSDKQDAAKIFQLFEQRRQRVAAVASRESVDLTKLQRPGGATGGSGGEAGGRAAVITPGRLSDEAALSPTAAPQPSRSIPRGRAAGTSAGSGSVAAGQTYDGSASSHAAGQTYDGSASSHAAGQTYDGSAASSGGQTGAPSSGFQMDMGLSIVNFDGFPGKEDFQENCTNQQQFEVRESTESSLKVSKFAWYYEVWLGDDVVRPCSRVGTWRFVNVDVKSPSTVKARVHFNQYQLNALNTTAGGVGRTTLSIHAISGGGKPIVCPVEKAEASGSNANVTPTLPTEFVAECDLGKLPAGRLKVGPRLRFEAKLPQSEAQISGYGIVTFDRMQLVMQKQ